MVRRVVLPSATGFVMLVYGVVLNWATSKVPHWVVAHQAVVWVALIGLLGWSLFLAVIGAQKPGTVEMPRSVGIPVAESLRPPHVEIDAVRGRSGQLGQLEALARRPEGRFVVVAGPGGMGKTTVALALAARVQAQGLRVFWVRWRAGVSLADQMVDVALGCGLPLPELEAARAGHRSVLDVVWDQLGRASGWLLVLDNVDSAGVLAVAGEPVADYRGWVRPTGGGLLVVTSRDRDATTWGPRAKMVVLGPLSPAEGARVLLDAAPAGGDVEQAEALSARVGGYPLVLHAVGAALASPTAAVRSFDGYRAALDTSLGTLLGADAPDSLDPEVARTLVRYTWELSLDQLAAEGQPASRAMLRVLSLLAEAPIPRSFVTAELMSGVLERDVSEPEVEGALAGLYRYGLIQVPDLAATASVPTLLLHPVIRQTQHGLLAEQESDQSRWRQEVSGRLIHLTREALESGLAGANFVGLVAPHLTSLIESATRRDPWSITACTLAMRVASLLKNAGLFVGALGLCAVVADAEERILGPEHPDTLHSRENFALTLQALARFAEAEQIHRKVLEVQTRVLGLEHAETLSSTRNNLANAIYAQGRFAEAEEIHRQALEAWPPVLRSTHPNALVSRNNHAVVLACLGRFAEAEQIHREVLEIRTQALGPEDRETLGTRNNLAEVLNELGQFAEAEQIHRQVLAIRTRVLGSEDRDTLESRHNLANALHGLRRFTEAEQIQRQVIEAWTRVLGPEHPATLESCYSLAVVLHSLGRFAEAEQIHRQVLEIRIRVLGPEHPATLQSRNELAQKRPGHSHGYRTILKCMRRRP